MTIQVSVFLIVSLTIVLMVFFYPNLKQKRLLRSPFPAQWLATIKEFLPFYSRMSSAEQQQLKQMVQLFIAEKQFFGCEGQVVTDEVKLVIAAQACLLLLNKKTKVYPDLRFILVYPSAFFTQHQAVDHTGVVSKPTHHTLGESWDNGKVIVSWDDSVKGVQNFRDGQNVVLHEFSHQLDSESGSTNGAPTLPRNLYQAWANVLNREYERLVKSSLRNNRTFLDHYGATNPAEFFAVATEHFFEQPYKMQKNHPELFEQFKAFYKVDTRNWFEEIEK